MAHETNQQANEKFTFIRSQKLCAPMYKKIRNSQSHISMQKQMRR